VFGQPSDGAPRLAAYVRETVRLLAAQSEFAQGKVYFPDPETILEGRPYGVDRA
jgi:hypothetical protein